jgi:hypothetical protein
MRSENVSAHDGGLFQLTIGGEERSNVGPRSDTHLPHRGQHRRELSSWGQ